jgi:hypothetical protein
MKTLLKIAFGIALGVAGCLAFYFYENAQKAQQGLRRGWVPIEKTDPVTTPAKPAEKPAPAKPVPLQPPGSSVSAKAPKSASKPAVPLAPWQKPSYFPTLAAQRWRWPQAVKLTVAIEIPLLESGRRVGSIPLSAGENAGVAQVQPDGRVMLWAKGQQFIVHASVTNLVNVALPEGTPPPPPPAPKPRPAPAPPAAKPATKNSGKPASGKPANDKNAHPEDLLPPPPPSDGPAPTLFGVPIK